MIQFINATVYTFDRPSGTYSLARSLTVEGSRIADVGVTAGAGVRCVDLDGAVVVPAFCDAHVHLEGTGMRAAPFDLSACNSAAAFDRAVECLPVSSRLFAAGYDDASWPDGPAGARALERTHADAVALLVRVDGHSSLANRRTLEWLDLPSTAGGIERDAGGNRTGRLFGSANWQAQAKFFAGISTQERQAAMRRACDVALSRGTVHLHAQLMGLPDDEAYTQDVEFLRALDGVNVHPKICERRPALAARLGLTHIGGDVFLDGSLGSGTAALCQPYADRESSGELALSDAAVLAFFEEAESLGISAGVHAIGDRAIDQAVRAIDRVQGSKPSRHTTHFIEHAEMATDEHNVTCARLGVAFSMQPQFDATWGSGDGMYVDRLGMDRAKGMNRLASARKAGVLVAGGSDSPVCRLSALDGMAAACRHHVVQERLSPLDALTAYSYDGARLSAREPRTGVLAPGFDADFVVLDRDPFANGCFDEVEVRATWSRGRCVFRNDGGPLSVEEPGR